MLHKHILQEIQVLPEFLQKEVLDFLQFLKQKHLNEENKPQKPTFGCGAVKITMSEDFDDPLEDFKEYM